MAPSRAKCWYRHSSVTPERSSGSRRFAEALLSLAAMLAVATFAHAEDSKPATTTNADPAAQKIEQNKNVTPKADAPAEAKPVEVQPAEPPPVKGSSPARPQAPARPAREAKPAREESPTSDAKPAVTAPAAAAPAAEEPPSAPAAAPVAAAAPASATPEAETVWNAYSKRWSETEDYSAGFRQIIEVPDVGSRVESAGRFYFSKPGLVRWEYTEGPPQTVVGDGTWIWLYQPDLEQVYKIPYAKAFGRGGLVELLAGREGVSERYTATLQRPDATSVRILLKPRQEGTGDLEVTLEADSFDIREVVVHDAAGSTTKMTFAEPRRNHGIDKARFTFTPPDAVDIISESEAGF
jgi:outer membrane lipoprotein carrier protein